MNIAAGVLSEKAGILYKLFVQDAKVSSYRDA